MSAKVDRVAIVGATGAVGLEMQKILASKIQDGELELVNFASKARPERKILALEDSLGELAGCRYVLNASSAEVARYLKEHLAEDQILIDNSSAFRMDPSVPLVIPEVNGDLLQSEPSVIANPNCTAILLCMTLRAFKETGIQRVTVATYQAASGAGIKGLEELQAQERALALGEALPKPEVFPFQLAGNVLSHNSEIRGEDVIGAGYNDEEWKVIEETRKILDIRHLALSATCIRVPVKRAHTEAVTVDLKHELSLTEIRELFSNLPGLRLVDDWKANHFPMPIEAEEKDEVLVGRLRKDVSMAKTVHYMLAGDQLRKGAALNAIQIMYAHQKLLSA